MASHARAWPAYLRVLLFAMLSSTLSCLLASEEGTLTIGHQQNLGMPHEHAQRMPKRCL